MSVSHKVFPIFYFQIDSQNKFLIHDKVAYEKYRQKYFPPGSKGLLVLKPHRKMRSAGQRGWYYGVILPMAAEDRGYDTEELHEAYIQAFAPDKVIKDIFTGEEKVVKKRPSEMSTVEFAEFCEAIRREEAERGLIIPDPEKVDTEE